MEGNSPDRSLSRRQEKNLLNAASAAARTRFENPDRIGCPDSRTLSLLARRHPSVEASPDLIDHIGTCSPCFIEYSQIRTAHKLRVRISYTLVSVAAVVVLAIAVARTFNLLGGSAASNREQIASAPQPTTDFVLDLRMVGQTRSDVPESSGQGATSRLPRQKLSLSVYLPVGSEEGTYQVSLVDPSEKTLRTATSEARFRDFVQVLRVNLNLTGLSPGPYKLRIRRSDAPWNAYPVLLQ